MSGKKQIAEVKSLKRKATALDIPEDATAPPHRVELNFKKKELVVYVTLHKIPDRFISLHVTSDEFFLHTLEYSKKFYLKYVPLLLVRFLIQPGFYMMTERPRLMQTM